MNAPKPQNILDSPQWVSESSASQLPEGDGSVSPSVTATIEPPPPDCDKCHIDFYKEVVAVVWTPGGKYDATSNVRTSNGGWEPDYWDPGTSPGGATVTADGLVTFGNEGESIGLSCGVKKCPKCKGSFTLHIVKLSIFHDQSDVTGKSFDAFAGEEVNLGGKVAPGSGSDWEWAVPQITVKDFNPPAVGQIYPQGHKVDYDPADFKVQAVALHWVNGGAKSVTLTAKSEGLTLTATTGVNVIRPSVSVLVAKLGPTIKPVGQFFRAEAEITFTAAQLSEPGALEWVQLADITRLAKDLNGGIIRDDHISGLDGCHYPNANGVTTGDAPAMTFDPQTFGSYKRTLSATMYLLWKSPKPGVFVPLRSVSWQYNGVLESTGTTTAPVWSQAPPPNPVFTSDPEVDQLQYPSWTDCIPVN